MPRRTQLPTTPYESPFYRTPDPLTTGELNARGAIHGQRVRGARAATPGTGGGDAARNLTWAYGKKSWARIVSTRTGIVLGSARSPVMSNRAGNLTMYSAARNVPNMPLLQGLDISNEGTMGSLLKGKFTFTIYPSITTSGFQLGNIEDAFFTPGAEVNVSWGWSTAAANPGACSGRFTGIIYNFNWSVNPDLSITADCSIVSAATVSTGMSGDVNTGTDPGAAPVTIGANPLPGPNIAAVIDRDMAAGGPFAASYTLAPMTSPGYIVAGATNMRMVGYQPIGLPFQPVEPESTGNTDPAVVNQGAAQIATAPPPPPIQKPFYYIKYYELVGFINKAINQLEAGSALAAAGAATTMGRLFRVQVEGNFTAWYQLIKSAFPVDVFFPDDVMGEYGGSTAFAPPQNYLRSEAFFISPPGVINGNNIAIGNILIGTDFIKKTYKEFVAENAANISHKNLTSFFETISKRINYASGDIYQITPTLYETEDMSTPGGGATGASAPPTQAILSIEDTNLAREIIDGVRPFQFGVDIYRAIVRTASITCKPPAASAAAAYTAARGEDRNTTGAGGIQPTNSDVKAAPTSGGTPASTPDPAMGVNAGDAATELTAKYAAALTDGFNNAWGEQVRGLITKWKKSLETSTGMSGANGHGHWMNKAVYPIDLTLTIDGVMGFKFGDAIECMAIPARYNQAPWNVSFTITKVSHKIDAGAWTTTLNTKARVNMGG